MMRNNKAFEGFQIEIEKFCGGKLSSRIRKDGKSLIFIVMRRFSSKSLLIYSTMWLKLKNILVSTTRTQFHNLICSQDRCMRSGKSCLLEINFSFTPHESIFTKKRRFFTKFTAHISDNKSQFALLLMFILFSTQFESPEL